MKVTVMGIDYNHLLSGKALAEMGNEVTYISNDYKRINNIKRGCYNANEAMVIKNNNLQDNFKFSADIKKSLSGTHMCFIAEGSSSDNEEPMEEILNSAKIVGENMTQHMFIVDRSEASHSRVEEIEKVIQNELTKRNASHTFEVISNPDFLRV